MILSDDGAQTHWAATQNQAQRYQYKAEVN